MKTILILLVLVFSLFSEMSFGARVPVRIHDSDKETSTTSKESSKKDPSALPCIPQQTHADKVDDLAKLEGPFVHSTNCPAGGAIKTAPGSRSQIPATQPADPVEVR